MERLWVIKINCVDHFLIYLVPLPVLSTLCTRIGTRTGSDQYLNFLLTGIAMGPDLKFRQDGQRESSLIWLMDGSIHGLSHSNMVSLNRGRVSWSAYKLSSYLPITCPNSTSQSLCTWDYIPLEARWLASEVAVAGAMYEQSLGRERS